MDRDLAATAFRGSLRVYQSSFSHPYGGYQELLISLDFPIFQPSQMIERVYLCSLASLQSVPLFSTLYLM